MPLLIVFTGLPGTGKSAIAEPVGRKLGIPVFAKDWLEATLRRCGLMPGTQAGRDLGYASYELLTNLAARQLQMGQSVILDSVASFGRVRGQWRDLTAAHRAKWRVIECVCSDETLHRARLKSRQRGIPGWDELTWREVEEAKRYYEPWEDERLILDMVKPLRKNLKAALDYLQA